MGKETTVSVRAIFNPNGVVSHLRHRATTPLGLADTTRFSQGSLADSATLGFGAESLWDSALEYPKGIELKLYLTLLTASSVRRLK